jgi:predicted methyltransferase
MLDGAGQAPDGAQPAAKRSTLHVRHGRLPSMPASLARRCLLALAALLALSGCSRRAPSAPAAATRNAPAGVDAAALQAIVAAPDRSAEDRQLDLGRHPAEMLDFFGVKLGMHVAELGAGTGYTTELLARAVGPSGLVYAQNSPFILKRFAEKPWSARLRKPVMRNVVRVDRPFDDPLPPEARNLDAVLLILFYHDTVWMGVDRAAMNRAVYRALRPGGVYGVVDHSARPGSGTADVQTLHRIDESVVREEIAAAGFQLQAEATFLRNPEDARDWNASPSAAAERRGTSDRFVLRFVKPLAAAAGDAPPRR